MDEPKVPEVLFPAYNLLSEPLPLVVMDDHCERRQIRYIISSSSLSAPTDGSRQGKFVSAECRFPLEKYMRNIHISLLDADNNAYQGTM